jgi:hypothetical protein
MIGPDLAKLQKDFEKSNSRLVLVGHGDTDANRKLAQEHGLECPILLLGDKTLEAFQNMGTPSAYLLDEKGKVVEPMAVGADAVPDLARSAAAKPGKRRKLPGDPSPATKSSDAERQLSVFSFLPRGDPGLL